MAPIQPVLRRTGHGNIGAHGLELSPEVEVTLVEQRPSWRSGGRQEIAPGARDRAPRPEAHRRPARAAQSLGPALDRPRDVRALATRADHHDEWEDLLADLSYGDVTDVDLPALPVLGDTTLPDLPALPDDATEEVEPTLLDTPALPPPLTPVLPMPAVHHGDLSTERFADPPEALPTLSPWRMRQASPSRAQRPTPGNGKRLTRSDREAMARVIALAKPRISTTRTPPAARPMGIPSRTAGR
jgi:hypothetical protein